MGYARDLGDGSTKAWNAHEFGEWSAAFTADALMEASGGLSGAPTRHARAVLLDLEWATGRAPVGNVVADVVVHAGHRRLEFELRVLPAGAAAGRQRHTDHELTEPVLHSDLRDRTARSTVGTLSPGDAGRTDDERTSGDHEQHVTHKTPPPGAGRSWGVDPIRPTKGGHSGS
jgi:hypothetical protein